VATLGLPGLTDRAAMRAWIYHLPIGQLGALGEMIGAAGFAFVLVAAVVIVWRRLLLEAGLLLALVAVFWLWIPYQESRFLFPAFGVAAVALGRATGPATGPLSAPFDWRLAVVLAGLVEYSTPERWLIVPVGALGAATAMGWRQLPERARRPLRSMLPVGLAALVATAGVTLTLGLQGYRARDPGYAVGTGIDDAWAWFRGNVRGARVAYTGTNLGFPLAGPALTNRVTYVNVAGAPGDRLHDFGRRLPPPGRAATPESAPYRDGASFDVWWRNLRAARADLLFVAALDEIVARNVAADGDGFPVERAWADAHPTQFHLRYASPDARVYGIAP
jgi:hypothetical protein